MRCPCAGESYPLRSIRVTTGEGDPAECILDGCEEATGERPIGCPWQSYSDPYVAEVLRAHRWWRSGQLADRYAGSIPASIAWGVEVYDAALNSVQVYDMRADREKREADRREREANGPRMR